MPDPAPQPVAQLLRVSTEGQADRLGLPVQERANAETAARFGLEIVETVRIVMSGADVATSPGMEHLLSMIEAGRASGIVVAAYDRLFRPERWSDMMVLQRLQDAGAGIWTPTGEIDLTTETGHIQATLYNLFAAMERRRIRDRMAAGREEKRRRGDHVGFRHSIPFGLDWTKENGWRYTPEAATVAEIFRRFLAGERSCEAISQAVGIGRTTVRYILGNEVYTGWRVYDEKRGSEQLPCGDKRKVKRAASEVIRVRLRSADGTPLEPIVSRDDWLTVQRYLEEGQLKSSRANARTEGRFVYRGVLRCATPGCGCTFYHAAGAKAKDGTYKRFYHCKTLQPRYGPGCGAKWMSEHLLDPVLDEALARALTDRTVLKRALTAYRDQAPACATPALDPSALLAKIEEKRARVLDAFIDGALSRADRDARLAKLDRERERLEETAPASEPLHRSLRAADILSVVRVFRRFHRLSFDRKREVLDAVRPRLFVGHYEVDGVWLDGRLFEAAGGGDSANLLKKEPSRLHGHGRRSPTPLDSCSSPA